MQKVYEKEPLTPFTTRTPALHHTFLQKRWGTRYHRNLLDLHDKRFFPFKRFLQQSELDYLEACYRLIEQKGKISSPLSLPSGDGMFSHIVQSKDTNSSLLAYGSWKHSKQLFQAAQPLLKEHQLPLPFPYEIAEEQFLGIGWNFVEKSIALYFNTHDPAQGFLRRQFKAGYPPESTFILPTQDEPQPNSFAELVRLFLVEDFKHASTPRLLQAGPKQDELKSFLNHQGQHILKSYRLAGENNVHITLFSYNHFILHIC